MDQSQVNFSHSEMKETIKSESHLNHPKKSIPGTAPRKKMDYFKENFVVILAQFEDGLSKENII